MSNRELEHRVRAWYLEDDGEPVAPVALRERVASIPTSMPVASRPLAGRRGIVFLAAAALLVGGSAIVAGSGLLREAPVVPPQPSPMAIQQSESSARPESPAPSLEPTPAPAIVHGGNTIAYSLEMPQPGTSCGIRHTVCMKARLWTAALDGTSATELVPNGQGSQALMGWTGDGSSLLYSDDGALFLVGARGGAPQALDTGCAAASGQPATCESDSELAVSPDGRSLAFVRIVPDTYATGIATMDLATGDVTMLSSTMPAGGVDPGWSPDGRRIVFSRFGTKDDLGPTPRVTDAAFIVDADGSNLHQLTPADRDAIDAAWSPDGARILFLSPSSPTLADGPYGDVYTIRPDGSDLRRLTFDGHAATPTWTPDGQILYVQGPGTDGFIPGVWILDPDTGSGSMLVTAAALGVPQDQLPYARPALQPLGGQAILPPPWSPKTAVAVGPAAPTPAPTPAPDLAPGFAWTGAPPAADDGPLGATATRLADGRVLVTAGCGTSAALYDPASGTFTTTGSMSVIRAGASATLLGNGRVLFAGGYNCAKAGEDGLWASAELYDPATGTFTPTGSMAGPRESQTATVLPDGRVLIAGGMTGPAAKVAGTITFASVRLVDTDPSVATAELYDPVAGTFSPTGSMGVARSGHTATLLKDGRVLVTGGGGEGTASRTSAELYDPASGAWQPTGSMHIGRWLQTASLLPDGRVLIAGGRSPRDSVYRSAELYDPTTGTFSTAGSLHDGRQQHTATVLGDGRVLIAGGFWSDGQHWNVLSSAELYDPATNRFTAIGSMGAPRSSHNATLLGDGRVLIVGGEMPGSDGMAGAGSAVLYTP